MENLIPVVNRLQDVFALLKGGAPVDLPQIVVVGGQSSGKSSVLENIVGRDFLPRGAGIVTRRPLVLQLINTPQRVKSDDQSNEKEWGEFLHRPNQRFYDFDEIRQEISRETDRLTGSNAGISSAPINLKIFSPHVLNLTMVDLPGMTKVPVGDQPADIESQIRNMILSYIERPNTIILAVSAANADLSNSDALQLARQMDPEGKRTLGVITKLDIMDKGTDALDVLTGRVIPLKLGYVGVVNRSQKDIKEKKPIGDALRQEREFFNTSPIYKTIASRCGTTYLASTLSQLLMNHIRNTLPDIKAKIAQMVKEAESELRSYGDSTVSISKGALLLQIISTFASSYSEMIEGKVADQSSTEELYGGARINYIFNEVFSKYLHKLTAVDGLSSFDIKTAISNATGPKAALFVPEAAFESLCRRQIARIREPCLQCVDLTFDELERIVTSIDSKELQRFGPLREALIEEAVSLLRACREPTKEIINNFINMELNFVNTNHPDFKISDVIAQIMRKRQQEQEAKNKSAMPGVPPSLPNPNTKPPTTTTTTGVQSNTSNAPNNSSGNNNASASNFNFFMSSRLQPAQAQSKKEEIKQDPSKSSSASQSANSKHLKLDHVPNSISVNSITQEKDFEIELLEGLLDCYFGIVRKNIQDYVPKAIMYFMVSKSKADMQNELISRLYKEDNFEQLLSESSDLVQKRQNCRTRLEVLQKASLILNEVRDFNIGNRGGRDYHL